MGDMLCEQVMKRTPLSVEEKRIIDTRGLISDNIMVGTTLDQLEINKACKSECVYILLHSPFPLVKCTHLLPLTCSC